MGTSAILGGIWRRSGGRTRTDIGLPFCPRLDPRLHTREIEPEQVRRLVDLAPDVEVAGFEQGWRHASAYAAHGELRWYTTLAHLTISGLSVAPLAHGTSVSRRPPGSAGEAVAV